MGEQQNFLVNFTIRAVVGMGMIFLANQFFVEQEIGLQVGFNLVSVLTSGCLGVPGVALLYGIAALPIL